MHIKDAKQRPGMGADRDIKYCPECEQCWEYVPLYRGATKYVRERLHHYKDFPTYGKKREVCKKCKERNE
jgi:hypothetical protein|tara:strand:- start:194 stop:403 length:210 start_codon:yes stop_codon:yes gene_type:complete